MIALVVIIHMSTFNAIIPSASMRNQIDVNDRILGSRLSYILHGPDRYDIVIFRYPLDKDVFFIKRVIGLPGETVDIRDGKIYINNSDVPLTEDYLAEEWIESNDDFHFEVPTGSYLMLGDNRNISLDARFWSDIALSEGLASDDEEAMKFTYVSMNDILAKALIKYYPSVSILK